MGTGELVVNYRKLREIAQLGRKIKPEIKIWIGGGLVTNSPYEAMKLIPDADYGMIGEGEETSLELIKALESGGRCKRYRWVDYPRTRWGVVLYTQASGH